MRAIMIMFDSLNRHMLPPYGCDSTYAPNFARLAEKSVTFENSFVGSMPCMPARRDFQTGRYNFLHRSWGPMEPFDESVPEILNAAGVHSHLSSDHYHYWEDGGSTYHTRYTTWESFRGQEGDPWKGVVEPPEHPESLNDRRGAPGGAPKTHQDWINRLYARMVDEFPQGMTFGAAMEFLETNKNADRWFLQIETFDPHEPFFSHPDFKKAYPDTDYRGPHFDWPPYSRVEQDAATVEQVRKEYAALLSMCDFHLGRVLDFMDRHDMWKDTLLIVNTDHGFLLGEHGWWAKCVMPFYNEVARTPLFIWDPRSRVAGSRRNSIVQMIDFGPTLLEFFGIERPDTMLGCALRDVVARDQPVRDAALFGIFGGHVNVTDGRYVYMRGPVSEENSPLYEYTLMPTRHGGGRAFMECERLRQAQLVAEPFSFTKGCGLLKVPGAAARYNMSRFGTLLFDIVDDPYQERPLPLADPANSDVERRLIRTMKDLMALNEAPTEQYERLGI